LDGLIVRWFRRKKRKAEARNEPKVNFVCEQDGITERALKSSLADLFASVPNVQRAYLVRVDYGDPLAYEVALCICPSDPDEALVKEVEKIFAVHFGPTQHMDIVFLGEDKERDVAKICNPFYRHPTSACS
jgi:hypothetical protein